ncbi:MAG: protein translocase subunit SecF [Thaumarchaeota archaeon]|nr:protein translocase subunit SecF [Nitrososphaerota archaeon]
MKKQPLGLFLLIILALSATMAATTPYLISHTVIGLEFKGGYEILYTAESLQPGKPVDQNVLLNTAKILATRANSLGVSEPQVSIEGNNEIKVELAGVSNNSQVKSIMEDQNGLPVKLTEKYSETVGGVLGKSDLKATFWSGVIALGIILGFMMIFYRGVGLVASFTVATYLWLLLLFFNVFHGVLSLAAVVTFVLGMGIAVDANIIAYERIREELRRGESITDALKRGEHNSFHIIMHANITTVIAGLVLFFAGIGPIKGFAFTLILSIIVSIASNVFLSRILLKLLVQSDLVKRLSFFGIRIRPTPESLKHFSFVKHRYKFFAISAGIAALGVFMLFTTELNYDIDFKAGTALDITLDKPITQDIATTIMEDAGVPPATVAIGGQNSNTIAVRFDNILNSTDINTVISAFKENYTKNVSYEENTYDPAVAQDLATKALYVILVAVAAVVTFVTIRFSWRFSITSAISVLNSAFFVLAMFAIFKLEIDVTFIAAILTVIGFATYNTIVIFDRIRENLRLKAVNNTEELHAVINQSIWQMMTRSVNTLITVVIAALCVYFFAAEPLQNFSLAILFGLICGTYSSICIGTPLYFMLKKRSLKVIV